MFALLCFGVSLGALPLLGHQPPEALLIDRQALLGRHLQGEVDRETVGVVQREGLVAGDRGAASALELTDGEVEDLGAGAQVARKESSSA